MSATGPFELGAADGSVPFVEIGPEGLGLDVASDGRCRFAAVSAAGQAPATIRADRRGLVLEVRSHAPLHVNGRPVRELALLRAGDVVVIGQCRLLIRTVRVPKPPPEPAPTAAPSEGASSRSPRIWLRCVTGRHAGQVRALLDGATLPWTGHHGRPGARCSLEGGQLIVRASGSDLRVDGHRVAAAVLHGGEQLVIEDQHYVLDGVALGFSEPSAETGGGPASEPATSPQPAVGAQVPETSGGFSPWWLWAAALAIAGALFMLFGRL